MLPDKTLNVPLLSNAVLAIQSGIVVQPFFCYNGEKLKLQIYERGVWLVSSGYNTVKYAIKKAPTDTQTPIFLETRESIRTSSSLGWKQPSFRHHLSQSSNHSFLLLSTILQELYKKSLFRICSTWILIILLIDMFNAYLF